MVNFFKRKWQGCAGEDAKILESRRKCVEVLRHLQSLQSQRDELEAKFLQERAALEAKYQKFYEPLDTERYCIVNGVREIGGATNEVAADEQGATDARKGVSNFWVNAMKTLEVLAEEITERDEEALGYLKDIRWHRIENSKGFELEFIFAVNPFFKNDVLTKTYYMIDEDELILEKAIGTVIEWYPGKCLTLKKMAKEESKNANPITKSFFNFFSPPHVPEDDDDNVEDTTEEELQNRMGRDYEVGSTIRDKVIPYAVSLFTIEAAYEDEDDYDSDAYDSGTDEDEDEC